MELTMIFRPISFLFICFFSLISNAYGTEDSSDEIENIVEEVDSENSDCRVTTPRIKRGEFQGKSWTCEIYDNTKNELSKAVCEEIESLENENYDNPEGGYKDCSEEEKTSYKNANTPDQLLNLYEGSPKKTNVNFKKPQVIFFLIKEEDQKLVAFSAWTLKTDEQGKDYAQIKRFHVKPKYQGAGSGRAFFDQCLCEICSPSYLTVDATASSMVFYLKSVIASLGNGVIMDKNIEGDILRELNKFKHYEVSKCLFGLTEGIVKISLNQINLPSRIVAVAKYEVIVEGYTQNRGLEEIKQVFIVSPGVSFSDNRTNVNMNARPYPIYIASEYFGAESRPYPIYNTSEYIGAETGVVSSIYLERCINSSIETIKRGVEGQIAENGEGVFYHRTLQLLNRLNIDNGLPMSNTELEYWKTKLDADPGTVELMEHDYTKDAGNVWHAGKKLEGADPSTFEVLSRIFSKDKYSVWYEGKKLEGADPGTFEVIEVIYSRDASNVWHAGKKLEGADLSTFEVLDRIFSKDKYSVWFRGHKIEGADPGTFESICRTFSKDKYSVWRTIHKLEGADPGTFELIDQGFSRDEYSVWFRDRKMKGADPATFHPPLL